MAAVPPRFGDMFKEAEDLHKSGVFAAAPQLKLKLRQSAPLSEGVAELTQETEQDTAAGPPRTKVNLSLPLGTGGRRSGALNAFLRTHRDALGYGAEAKLNGVAEGLSLIAKADSDGGGRTTVAGEATHKGLVDGLALTAKVSSRSGADLGLDYVSALGLRVAPALTVRNGALGELRGAVTCAAAAGGGVATAGLDGRCGADGALAAAAVQAMWRCHSGKVLVGARADLCEAARPVTVHALVRPTSSLSVGLSSVLTAPPPAPADRDGEGEGREKAAGPAVAAPPSVSAGAAYRAEWVAQLLRADKAVLSARCATQPRQRKDGDPADGAQPQGELGVEAQWGGGVSARLGARAPLGGDVRAATTVHTSLEFVG
eukprot:TRINITY_DN65424_c0_g1_i1.p1 TRINITY_DN65424_c0_g1~~TRINITY_DN65424_c0_g1_i1.p1  ORF type:complete len:409 (+),score=112.98 TRINITY_DN65424_c0_g1_i1:109-1227(+)